MFSHRVQHAPQVDEFLAVQMEGLDCGASCGRESDNKSKIVAPRKMVMPSLLSRMIKRNDTIGHGVARFCLGVLVVITSLAREREIVV